MAQVQIEEVVDHLRSEFRRALAEVFATHAPDVPIDEHQVFRDFKRAIYRKCNTWETVPNQYVKT